MAAAKAADKRTYDITVLGATGFTGRLVCEYLRNNYSNSGLKWAVAGRNEKKVVDTKKELGLSHLPHLIASSDNQESLDKLAAESKVIISTVGPYAIHGTPLVAACASKGTHMVDLTGETLWVKEVIDKYHDQAKSTGARIINSCGFDSIPADMGAYIVAQHLKKQHNTAAKAIYYYPASMGKGGFSGGTAASAVGVAEACWKSKQAQRQMGDPYLLVPADKRPSHKNPSTGGGFGYDRVLGGWTAPWLFAGHDSKIVHRSSSQLNYGSTVVYKEVALFRHPLGFIPAALATLVSGLAALLVYLPPSRALLKKFVLPLSGQGPDKATREASYFWINLLGIGEDGSRVVGTVGSDLGDAGYHETAKMLSECALTLALDSDKLQSSEGGILTTAAGLGQPLVDRLNAAGMVLKCVDDSAHAHKALEDAKAKAKARKQA